MAEWGWGQKKKAKAHARLGPQLYCLHQSNPWSFTSLASHVLVLAGLIPCPWNRDVSLGLAWPLDFLVYVPVDKYSLVLMVRNTVAYVTDTCAILPIVDAGAGFR